VEDGLKIEAAFKKTFKEIKFRGKRMGAIGLDSKGSVAYQTTTEILLWAWQKGRTSQFFSEPG